MARKGITYTAPPKAFYVAPCIKNLQAAAVPVQSGMRAEYNARHYNTGQYRQEVRHTTK